MTAGQSRDASVSYFVDNKIRDGNRNLETQYIVIFGRKMILYSSLRSYLPLVRGSPPLPLCWIKQLITLHCGTRRQWQPFLLSCAAHKAKERSTARRNRWMGIRCTYTTSTRSSNSHSGIPVHISFYRHGFFRLALYRFHGAIIIALSGSRVSSYSSWDEYREVVDALDKRLGYWLVTNAKEPCSGPFMLPRRWDVCSEIKYRRTARSGNYFIRHEIWDGKIFFPNIPKTMAISWQPKSSICTSAM